MKVMEEDWLDWNTFKSSKDRNLHFLQAGIRSDCRFLVGIEADTQQIIEAHKLMLSKASPVFEVMFYGSLPESGKKAILVEDIEAEDFKDLLIFIYTNEISIKSIEKAQKLYYIATKYMVNDLKSKCIDYLGAEIKSSNACEIIGFAMRLEENDLRRKCLKFIVKNISEVIKSEAFYMADLITLEKIYSDGRLYNITELQLFKSLESYAEHRFFNNQLKSEKKTDLQAVNEKPNVSSEVDSKQSPPEKSGPKKENENLAAQRIKQQRTKEFDQFLKIVKNIRFLLMPAKDFASGPYFSKLLNKEDANNILLCIANPNNVDKYFPNGFSKSKSPRTYNCGHGGTYDTCTSNCFE